MVKDKILNDFEKLCREDFLTKTDDILDNNPFTDIDQIIEWLVFILKKRIKKQFIPSFSKAITLAPGIKKFLKDGNLFYKQLFNKDDSYIRHNTTNVKKSDVLTGITTATFNKIANKPYKYEEPLYFLTALRTVMHRLLGEKIAIDPELRYYNEWKDIHHVFEDDWEVTRAWLKIISANKVTNQLGEFASIDSRMQFNDLADHYEFRNRANHYSDVEIKNIDLQSNESIIDYISNYTRATDSLFLKPEIHFNLSLLKKIKKRYWIRYVDSLRFLNLQNIAFSEIDDIDAFPEIIKVLVNPKETFVTNRNLLVFVALNNFMKIIHYTNLELSTYKTKHYSHIPNAASIIKMADTQYSYWQKKKIPNAFTKIIDNIFSFSDLTSSLYFISFFEWINSYKVEENYSSFSKESSRVVMIIREVFQKKFEEGKNNAAYILNHYSKKPHNWESLEMLTSENLLRVAPVPFLDKLFHIYLLYIGSAIFTWNQVKDFSDTILRQAYRFSYLLSLYSDCHLKWQQLHKQYKIHHEGWNYDATSDYKLVSKESYILCVGIGLAYKFYQDGKNENAVIILKELLEICINQSRKQNQHKNEYIIPLQFIIVVYRQFSIQGLEELLLQLIEGLDDVKSVLELLNYAIFQSERKMVLTANSKIACKNYINEHFWLIEREFANKSLKNKLAKYQNFKEEIFKFLYE